MRWTLVALVALVMYSRMYLGVHYLTDLLVGAMLGAFIGYFMRRYVLTRFIIISQE
jgi:undecaprenyl-diphosphatase